VSASVPAACSHCGRAFSGEDRGVRLAHLEYGRAFCDHCLYLVEHPESAEPRPRIEERQAA